MLTRAAQFGFRRIIVFPYFLLTGVLVKQIYAQADAAARLFPEIEFVKALYLRDHPEVLGAFHDRVREVRAGDVAGSAYRRTDRRRCRATVRRKPLDHDDVRSIGADGHHSHDDSQR